MNHVEFLNAASNLFDPDHLEDLSLKDALICALVVVADYARVNYDNETRQRLCDVIMDDDRPLPDLIDASRQGPLQ